MNDGSAKNDLKKTNVANTSSSDEKTEQLKKPSRLNAFIVPVFLLVILITGLVYFNQRLIQFELSLNESNSNNQSIIDQLNQKLDGARQKLAGMEQALNEIEAKQALLAEAQPAEQQIYINKDYALAEVEHLLIIASYNLQLDHDVATALAAMEAADARLQGLDEPRVVDVRQQLIVEMNELRSMNQADLSGLGLYISDLINRVDQLPVKENILQEQNLTRDLPVDKEIDGIKQFFQLVWLELKSLIVITRDSEVAKARLLPGEIYFLRANIKLELANARFAVFNRDTENLRVSIEHIRNWIGEYFDKTDATVQNIDDSLARMTKMELAFPQLDISSSLESVRALIRYQDENGMPQNQ